ncbi:ATP-dependent Clp protease protease subunit [Paraburkholderia sp. JPY465]|uniref:head maturation protease, ClpP-related n=1 Tax=Paraburkholderia sp. JPY465 TaxID=3042285 RepID=UPI003D1BBF71
MAGLILKLLNDNRQSARRFEVVNDANGDVTLYLYDVIVSDDWYGGISAATFVQQLAQITAPNIHLRMNSPGGDVFSARAMELAIREHPSNIVAHVDGVAASAMSFVAIACDKVVMADGAFMMIHRGSCMAWGTGDDLRATAALLDKVDASLVNSYAKKTGQRADDIAAWMAAETWFSAAEAVELGFADEVAADSAPTNAGAWNLSAYAKSPLASSKPQTIEPPTVPAPDTRQTTPVEHVPPVEPAPKPTVDIAALQRRLALSVSL